MIQKARPISEVIQDERTPGRVKRLLSEIHPIKEFGEANGLKSTKNYTEYVHLDRDAALWVVSACESLKFKEKIWSFPIIGSVPYIGWFDRRDANEFVEELKKEGWDVDVRGAAAYSTLGWFRDSILSTMLSSGDDAMGDLVEVVLHESVHATYYIRGQSSFNESLANFVAARRTRVYLDQKFGPDSKEKSAYVKSEKDSEEYRKAYAEAIEVLRKVYDSPASDAEKRAEKNRVLGDLKEKLKIKREISNATLMAHKVYNTGEKELETLFQSCGSDWSRFLGTLKTLDEKSFPEPQMEDFSEVLPARCFN